jgi:hypothetical protein
LDRATTFIIGGSKVTGIKMYRKQSDSLNVEEVIKRGTMFTFETGTFRDTTKNYFLATTKDGRNAIQFLISDSGVSLEVLVQTMNGDQLEVEGMLTASSGSPTRR